MRSDAEGELSGLYKLVTSTMLAVHEGSQEPSSLIHIALQW